MTRERDEAEAKDTAATEPEEEASGKEVDGCRDRHCGHRRIAGHRIQLRQRRGPPAAARSQHGAGNPEWVTALAVMFPIFLSGGVIMAGYFAWQLSQKQAWGSFKTPSFAKNFVADLHHGILSLCSIGRVCLRGIQTRRRRQHGWLRDLQHCLCRDRDCQRHRHRRMETCLVQRRRICSTPDWRAW